MTQQSAHSILDLALPCRLPRQSIKKRRTNWKQIYGTSSLLKEQGTTYRSICFLTQMYPAIILLQPNKSRTQCRKMDRAGSKQSTIRESTLRPSSPPSLLFSLETNSITQPQSVTVLFLLYNNHKNNNKIMLKLFLLSVSVLVKSLHLYLNG